MGGALAFLRREELDGVRKRSRNLDLGEILFFNCGCGFREFSKSRDGMLDFLGCFLRKFGLGW